MHSANEYEYINSNILYEITNTILIRKRTLKDYVYSTIYMSVREILYYEKHLHG